MAIKFVIKPLDSLPQKAVASFPKWEESTGASGDFHRLKNIPAVLTPACTPASFTYAFQGTANLVSDNIWASRTLIRKAPESHLPSSIISDQLIGASLPRGWIGSAQAVQRFHAARAIEDTEGAIESGIDLGLYGVQSVLEVDYIGAKALTVTSVCIPASIPTAATVSAGLGVLTWIGNILFPLLSTCVGGWGAFQSWSAAKRYEEYEKNGKTFEFLENSIYISSEEIAESIEKDKNSLQILGETSLKKASRGQPIPGQGGYECASSVEKHLLLNDVLQMYFQEYPELPILKELYFSKVSQETFNSLALTTAIGLLLHLRKMQKKNEARIERVIGQNCLARIKKAAERGLTERAESCIPAVKNQALAERSALLAQVDSGYAKKQAEYKIMKWLGIFGIALGVAGFFLSGPIGPIVAFALTVLFALASIVADVYFQQNAFDGQPGSCDKLFITICAIGLVLSIGGSIAAFMVFGGAPLVLALSLTAGIIGLCIYGHAYYKIKQQEEQWNKEHPSLEDLARRLEWIKTIGNGRHKLDTRTLALFKKLPRPVRQAITKKAAALPFETYLYRKWDAHGSFGQNYLKCYLKNRREWDEIAVNQLRRAVKKTAKFFWKQWWYSNKQEYFSKQALQFEELFESIRIKDITRARKAYKKIQKSDSCVQDKLYENIRNVFKREESTDSLHEAVKHIRGRSITE